MGEKPYFSDFGISTYEEGSQLDRLEKKVDRVLNILENGKPSPTLTEAEQQMVARIIKTFLLV